MQTVVSKKNKPATRAASTIRHVQWAGSGMKQSIITLFAIIIFTISLSYCTIEPWRTIRYKDLDKDKHEDSFDVVRQDYKYFINDTYIRIGTQGKEATYYSSKQPYRLIIDLIGKIDHHLKYTIKDIVILSDSGIDYSELILNLPYTAYFEPLDVIIPNYTDAQGKYLTDFIFNFSGKEIYVKVRIEVTTQEKTEEDEYLFTLTRLIERGLFKINRV